MMIASKNPALQARIVTVLPLSDVRAGSALVWHAGRLLVVQDDAASVVWIDPLSGQTKRWVLEGTGEQLAKSQKPDFEVAFVGPGQTITILGSGSSPLRRRGATLDLDTHAVRIIDHGGLFDAIERALGREPNLEGGVLWENQLRLFHRGAGAQNSAIVEVNLDVLSGAPPRVLDVVSFDLGDIDGVPLHFTDATVIDERIVYVAVAEDTPNAIEDGPIAGAAMGFIDGRGAMWTTLMEPSGHPSRRKVEGVTVDPERRTIHAVTDPDDPDKPAELLTIHIDGLQSISAETCDATTAPEQVRAL